MNETKTQERRMDKLELAQAITEIPGYRDTEGMLLRDPDGQLYRVLAEANADDCAQLWSVAGGCLTNTACVPSPLAPVLSDPAAAGCLLVLLGDGIDAHSPRNPDQINWWIFYPGKYDGPKAPTLGEACALAAMELGRWPG
jgi:hypothetical protein